MSLLTSVISIWPMLKSGVSGVFYTVDPDVQYLSNSFSYIEKGKIQYDVHPGTPTILLHALILWPLRIYAKLVERQPFMTWVFNNVSWAYYYVRIFQAFWLGAATVVFLGAIYRWSKSVAVLAPAWFCLLTFTVFPYFGSTIVPETTSFFLISLWLLVLAKYHKKIPAWVCLTLSTIAGLAVANKFSNLTLVPTSLVLVGFVSEKKLKEKINLSLIAVLIMITTFTMATWSIRRSYPGMWSWVSVLASTTGTHGGGEKAFFDLAAYSVSAWSLVNHEWWPTLITAAVLVLLVGAILLRKVKLLSPLPLLGFIALASALVFAKFPLSHYQVANYALILFIGSVLLSYLPRVIPLIILVTLLPAVSANLSNYRLSSLMMMSKAAALEDYIAEHPTIKGTLWEWARNKDFSFLWSRDWAHGVFDSELSRYRPNLLAITPDMQMIKINNRELKEVFDVCWDQFFVQSVTAPRFLAKYPDRKLEYHQIPEVDDIGLIKSRHCQ